MSRTYNFSAGPAALPEPVLKQAQSEMLEWGRAQASVMEISHRGKEFIALAKESEDDLRKLLQIPQNYKVLFLQGGATQHFAQIPMNIAAGGKTADYIVNGAWGEKAFKEAKPVCKAQVAASSESTNFTTIPARDTWKLDPTAAYVHYTPNETIHGVEFQSVPDIGDVPLVADMSSNILSRPVDVSKFGIIYAGAQKNIGPSGLVILIIRDDLLARSPKDIPKIFSYAEQVANDSMLNTPNTFGWYLAGLTFKWLAGEGGLAGIEKKNIAKANLLYGYIDSSGFYKNPVEKSVRSRMNVPFTLPDEELDETFLKGAKEQAMIQLKGHRSVGGMRASIYNAMPLEGVRRLAGYMREFEKRHG